MVTSFELNESAGARKHFVIGLRSKTSFTVVVRTLWLPVSITVSPIYSNNTVSSQKLTGTNSLRVEPTALAYADSL